MQALSLRTRANALRTTLVTVLVGCGIVALAATAPPASASTGTFSNPATIYADYGLPCADPQPNPPAPTPYPSEINVSGMSGNVTDVNVTVKNITVENLSDLRLLLVSPDGSRNLEFMGDIGAFQTESGSTSATYTFDDAAQATANQFSGFSSGTYQPSNYAGQDVFTAPAPATSAATDLATFNGVNPNGNWQLFANDARCPGLSVISGGWSLDLTSGTGAPTAASITSSLNPSKQGQNVTFTATVTSAGNPVTTGTVTFTDGPTTLASNVALNASGKATFSTTSLAEGNHVVRASYSGTASFADVKGGWVDQRVNFAGTQTFSDTGLIFGAGAPACPAAPANPYPSTINVSGIAGNLTDVNVTLKDITASKAGDLQVMLVAPNGNKNLIVLSDAGYGTSLGDGATLTFDDEAAAPALEFGGYGTGRYKPTNYPTNDDTFFAPAPTSSGATTLATFNGIDPNGTWSLYVYDSDCIHDISLISGGWSLDVTGAAPVTASPKDILITEFRAGGPNGFSDEYIELYNNTASSISLAGWTLEANLTSSTPTLALPTVTIPSRGHFLVTGPTYSLAGYSAADLAYSTGFQVPLDQGVRVVSPSSTVIDAVGSLDTSPGFFEGTRLADVGITSAQTAWVRKVVAGKPIDTDNNRADFILVDTDAGIFGVNHDVQATRGAPGPDDLAAPVTRNDLVSARLIDPSVGAAVAPNRLYDSGTQTLTVRRTLKNVSTRTITALRLRMTSITAKGGPPAGTHAWLCWNDSTGGPVSTAGGPVTTVPVTVDDNPPFQACGGAWNSSGTIPLPGGSLAPGQSVSVSLVFHAEQGGSFSFGFDSESLSTP